MTHLNRRIFALILTLALTLSMTVTLTSAIPEEITNTGIADGTYMLLDVSSGKALNIGADNTPSLQQPNGSELLLLTETEDGVILSDFTSKRTLTEEALTFLPEENSVYTIQAASGDVLTAERDQVLFCPPDDTSAQRWQLVRVVEDDNSVASAKTTNIVPAAMGTAFSGTYVLTNKESGKCLNVPGNSDTNGQQLTVYAKDNSSGQAFNIAASGNYYTMSPVCSATGKVVNVYAESSAAGALVTLYAPTGHTTQQWYFDAVSGGYVIRSADNSSCVIAESGTANASGITLEAYASGDSGQIWTLAETEIEENDGTVKAWGIDVSTYQGTINWNSVKSSGVDFAIVRIGYGSSYGNAITIDNKFYTNMNGAIAAGLDVGLYLYSYAINASSGASEAAQIVTLLKSYSASLTYPIFMDVEDSVQVTAGATNTTAAIRAFATTMQNGGWYCAYYSYLSFVKNYINSSSLNDLDFWIASYGSNDGTAHAFTYSGSYTMWQYTSKGQNLVSGITSSGLDVNYSYVDYPKIIKTGGYNGFTATQTTYTVKYSDASVTSSTVNSGTSVTLPAAAGKTGYTFTGWLCSANNQTYAAGNSYTVTADVTFTAQYQINNYTVTYHDGSQTSSTTAAYGTSVTLPATAGNASHAFTGWLCSANNQTYTAGQSYTVTANVTFTAQYQMNDCIVSYLTDGLVDNTVTAYGASVTLPAAAAKTGYTFTGWLCSADGQTYPIGHNHTVTADVTFTAQYQVNNYTIIYLDGGQTDSTTASYGASVTLPVAAGKTGHAFTGWHCSADNRTYAAGDSYTVTENATFTAEYQMNSYTVTYQDGDHTGSTAAAYNSSITLPAAAGKTGYTFTGWRCSANSQTYSAGQSYTVTADVTFTAQYQINNYTVTYHDGSQTSRKTVAYGASVTLPTAAGKSGYAFTGWLCSANSQTYAAGQSYAVTANVTFTAQYQINSYTVTYFDGGQTNSTAAAHNASIVLPSAAGKTGYTFTGWRCSANNQLYAANNSYAVTANVSFTAVYQIISYTITYHDGTQTSNTTAAYGTSVTLPAAAGKTGYTFTGWRCSANNQNYAAGQNYAVTTNLTFTAQYQINSYTVTYRDGTQASNITATYGASITLPAAAGKTGYAFTGWLSSANNQTYAAGNSYTVTAPVTFTAQYQINGFTVTYRDGSQTSSTTVSSGSSVTLPAAAGKAGCTFTGWRCSTDNVLYAAGTSYPIYANTEFSATYMSLTPTATTVTFGHNLALENNISLGFLIKADSVPSNATDFLLTVYREDLSTGKMTESETLAPDAITATTLRFYYNGISAAEMSNICYAQLHYTSGGVSYVSQTDQCSVEEYALTQLAKSTTQAGFKTLLCDMLNYGAAAQIHFSYGTHRLANAALSDFEAYATKTVPSFTNVNVTFGEGMALGTSLSLESSVNLMLLVPRTAVDTAGIANTMSMHISYLDSGSGEVVELILTEPEQRSTSYAFALDSLAAAQFSTVIEAQLYNNASPVSKTRITSIESYFAAQMETATVGANDYNLYISVKRYSDSAIAYFGA